MKVKDGAGRLWGRDGAVFLFLENIIFLKTLASDCAGLYDFIRKFSRVPFRRVPLKILKLDVPSLTFLHSFVPSHTVPY